MAEVERRRRRVRRSSQPGGVSQTPGTAVSAETSTVHDPDTVHDPECPVAPDDADSDTDTDSDNGNGNGSTAGNGATSSNGATSGNGGGASSNLLGNGDEREAERGLRGLIGSGASQVSLTAAMRARDAARPDDTDIAAAERDLTIIRRGWVPREELPRNLR